MTVAASTRIITHSIAAHDGTLHHIDASRPVVVTNIHNQCYRGRVTGLSSGFVELRGINGVDFHMHRNFLASAENVD